MISAGRKCVQTAISGWYCSMSLTNGRVLSFSKRLLKPIVVPWPIAVIVEPAEDLGHFFHHIDIGFRVKSAEERVGVLEGIDVTKGLGDSRDGEGPLDRLGRADVARARRRRKNEDIP